MIMFRRRWKKKICESLISWDKEIIMKLTEQDDIKVRVFMNGPSKICGRQPLKNLKR